MSNPPAESVPLVGNANRAGHPRYVLITPARNEVATIELTIKSVICQTILPLRWVIVSDGSTDGTDEVVKRYANQHEWIELVRMPERKERHFAGKVWAFDAGFAQVKGLEYEIIGNLDADVSFESDYFSFLMNKFLENERLGVGGTAFREGSGQYDYRFTSIEHVSGQCQMFRRQCYEEIGGYVPQKGGGIDLVAVLKARMKGWETRTFPERIFEHHRQMGSAHHTGLSEKLHRGRKDYLLGGHPLWEVFRSAYQMKHRPYIIGGTLMLIGYLWTMLRGVERTIPHELMEFRRHDQMQRLKEILRRTLSSGT